MVVALALALVAASSLVKPGQAQGCVNFLTGENKINKSICNTNTADLTDADLKKFVDDWRSQRCTSWCTVMTDGQSRCNTKDGFQPCTRPVEADNWGYFSGYVFSELEGRLQAVNPDSRGFQIEAPDNDFKTAIKLGPDEARTVFAQPITLWNQAACTALESLNSQLTCTSVTYYNYDDFIPEAPHEFKCDDSDDSMELSMSQSEMGEAGMDDSNSVSAGTCTYILSTKTLSALEEDIFGDTTTVREGVKELITIFDELFGVQPSTSAKFTRSEPIEGTSASAGNYVQPPWLAALFVVMSILFLD